ncbi:hypothetical protein Bca4012_097403 [Brassica carinata]|uniref:Reverse transcriptase zinc-binding domain-containing protein n=1 Tax=Brassica carinata TaxID=52824 RepID=A0A8X7PZE1_BRACI|nr:hypothetical protein Bca52824_079894 [Brassica carinata]
MARVLKSRYFKNRYFLEASIGFRPSFIWRNILHGREALKSGMLRTIGSGEQTNVWTSNWLLDDELRPPMYRQNTCGQASETICHVLFLCPTTVEAWRLARIEPPPTGFSTTSSFLNLHYLVAGTKKQSWRQSNIKSFPWIVWNLWKGRNALMFEKTRISASSMVTKALEEAEIWNKGGSSGSTSYCSKYMD